MPIQAMRTAATGMEAMQTRLDVIANNLANANSIAFKRDRANTEDLFYLHRKLPGAEDIAGNRTPTGISIGLGTRISGVQTEFRQGNLEATNNPLDLAITGVGFFQVVDPATSEILYTRAGNFTVNDQGQLVQASATVGRLVDPPIQIPPDAQEILVSGAGVISVKQAGSQTYQQVGQLQLARFQNPDGLLKLGDNLYAQTDASGPPTIGQPSQDGFGTINQSMIELSNVEPVRELIDLINTQRTFELNSEAVKAGDQMLQLLANLRRF